MQIHSLSFSFRRIKIERQAKCCSQRFEAKTEVLQYPVRHDVDNDDDNNDDNDEDFQIEDDNCSSSEESKDIGKILFDF